MTSQSSTNNRSGISLWSLMREDLHHKHWMLALSILGSFFAGPVAFLFAFFGRYDYRNASVRIVGDKVYALSGEFLMTLEQYYQGKLENCRYCLSSYLLVLMGIIAIVGALIVAIFGFYFLYHKRMVDLYHSAPVSRCKLFTAIWLNGFLIWFVPALACSLLLFVEASIYMQGALLGSLFVSVMRMLLRLALCFLIIYHACLVPVMLSGNVINALVGAFSYGLLVFVMAGAVMVLAYDFYDTVYITDTTAFTHPLHVLSPFTTPVILLVEWASSDLPVPTYLWHLLAGIVIMLVNLILAYLLYLKRPSELAERGLEAKGVRIFFRFFISLLGGTGLALLFYQTARPRLPWMVFGALFGTAITFCILNVIYHGTFKEVFSHKLQYFLVLASTLALLLCMMFDVTGFDNRLPKKEDLTGISIYVQGLSELRYQYDPVTNKLLADGNEPIAAITSATPDQIHALLTACVNANNRQLGSYRHLNVKVNTKHGSYSRRYKLSFEDLELLRPFLESEEYAETYYPLKSMKYGYPHSILLSRSFTIDEQIDDAAKIRELTDAYHKDFEAHRSMEYLFRDSRLFTLVFYYGSSDGSRIGHYYQIPYWYENTIQLVKSWYPKSQWDPYPEDVTRVEFSEEATLYPGDSVKNAIYRHYGYGETGTPLSEPAKAPTGIEHNYYSFAHWIFFENDASFLKELEPYLIWGDYSDALTLDYVRIGWAELETGGNVDVYVKYGKLPLSLLNKMVENATVNSAYYAEQPADAEESMPDAVQEYYYD